MTKRQSYVLSPPTTAAAEGGKKGKRRNQLTMEDLEDGDVADGHFRPPKGGESSSSEEDEEDDDDEEEPETPPKRQKVKKLSNQYAVISQDAPAKYFNTVNIGYFDTVKNGQNFSNFLCDFCPKFHSSTGLGICWQTWVGLTLICDVLTSA